MNGKLRITLMSILVLGLTLSATAQDDPSLVGWWRFDEGTGTVATDSSGYGNDGVFVSEPQWVSGMIGSALHFDGEDDWVEVPHNEILNPANDEISVALWVNSERYNSSGEGWGGIMGKNGPRTYCLFTTSAGNLHFTSSAGTVSADTFPLDEWVHLAVALTGGQHNYYINGEAAGTGGSGIVPPDNTSPLTIGNITDANRKFLGMLDDVRVYNRGLTIDELPDIMAGRLPTLAANPSPANEDNDALRDSILTWSPGMYDSTHDLYLGATLEEVAGATVPTAGGLDVNSFDPGRLEFGQTYYWRVDEVNVSPDKTVHAGEVWSFTAEPYSILIPGAEIDVTASSYSNEFSTPEKVIDGSGLQEDGTHAINPDGMWFTASPDMDPWIQFDFEGVKQLDTMTVWNSNSSAEIAIGWGVKDLTIEYSVDGETWTLLEEASQFSRAPGLPTYDQPDVVAFDGLAAKAVRLTIASNWGGLLMSYSLSEVQFAAIPAQAREPEPASGSTDVVPNAVIKWRAGREADTHTVYLGTDADAVADGTAPSVSSNTNSLDLSSFDLNMGATYYWRVDEVNEAEATPVWAGPVWDLTTATSLTVDDFESYGNASPDRPFQTWLDGFGYSADEYFPNGYGGNGTGAGIGHDIWALSSPHYDGDIMETTTAIAGSGQSMPFYFTNSGGVASQTERNFAPAQDWTVGASQTLSIPFRGQSGNTGTLFVMINNTKVTYPHDATNIARAVWQAWNIDLTSVNTNLSNVTKLVIGVDGGSASGMILIDDITLHAEAGEVITPVEPDNANLVLHYTFDEGSGSAIGDASGNGYSGTFESIPQWATGVSGSAISLDGVGSYVDAPASAWSSVDTEFTISFWTNGDADLGNNWGFFAGDNGGRIVSCHAPWGSEVIFDSTPGWADERVIVGAADDELRGQWRQWAMVRTAGGDKSIYIDGVLYGSTTATEDPITGIDRFFIGAGNAADSPYKGLIDDFQLHNRALSAEEILWMAGVTTPIDKPF